MNRRSALVAALAMFLSSMKVQGQQGIVEIIPRRRTTPPTTTIPQVVDDGMIHWSTYITDAFDYSHLTVRYDLTCIDQFEFHRGDEAITLSADEFWAALRKEDKNG